MYRVNRAPPSAAIPPMVGRRVAAIRTRQRRGSLGRWTHGEPGGTGKASADKSEGRKEGIEEGREEKRDERSFYVLMGWEG
jgi:hypothetical protein